MKLQILPACKSTPERPHFVWRLWDWGKVLAWGVATTAEGAAEQADAALAEYRRTHRAAWLESVWEMADDD